MKNSSDQNGNVVTCEQRTEESAQDIEKASGNGKLEVFFAMRKMTVTCSIAQNSGVQIYHLQIALFLTRGHRGFRCLSCVKVNEDILQKCGPHI